MSTSFVLLGMPMAVMGVAWPTAATDLGRSLGELGLVTLGYGAGYTISTLASGELSRRLTTGPLLSGAAFVAAGSLAVITFTTTWAAFLAAVVLLGIAGGLLDAAVNAYVAVHRGARAMGVLHTGFGIGSAVGPLFATLLLTIGASWRIAFASLAVADLLLAVAFVAVAGVFDRSGPADKRRPSAAGKGAVVALSVTVFFFYAGVAAGTGVWAFSFLTGARGIGTSVAGVAVAGYWAALTMSRIILGVAGDRISVDRTLTASGIGTVVMLLIVWIAPVPWMAVTALVASGLAHGSIFPLEMVLTARRFGGAYTPWAVGYQIAGANVGVAILSGGIGFLVARMGVGVVAPTLVVFALALLAALETLRVRSARHPA
jgi:fucose permease